MFLAVFGFHFFVTRVVIMVVFVNLISVFWLSVFFETVSSWTVMKTLTNLFSLVCSRNAE